MARGRPRKTDPDEVFDAALTLFWQKGFAATSMNDLSAATGMAKPGLYANFGSKEELFAKALRSYFDQFLKTSGAEFANSDAPIDVALRDLFLRTIEGTRGDRPCVGCFLLNTVLETAHVTSDLHDLSRQLGEERRQLLLARLRKAQAAGELSRDADLDQLAQFISGQILAIAAMASEGASPDTLRAFADTALSVLPLERAA